MPVVTAEIEATGWSDAVATMAAIGGDHGCKG